MKIAAFLAVALACLVPLPGAKADEKQLAEVGDVVVQVAVVLADLINELTGPLANLIDWLVDDLGDVFVWLMKFMAGIAKFAGDQTNQAKKGENVEKKIIAISDLIKAEGFSLAKDGATLIRKTGEALYKEAKNWAQKTGASSIPAHIDVAHEITVALD